MVSVNHGRVTSIQLDGTVVAKTSSSPKETSGSITLQSSCTISARWYAVTDQGRCHGWQTLHPLVVGSDVKVKVLI